LRHSGPNGFGQIIFGDTYGGRLFSDLRGEPSLGRLFNKKNHAAHPVWEKSERADGILSRPNFIWDKRQAYYICPNREGAPHQRLPELIEPSQPPAVDSRSPGFGGLCLRP
jgi:hypothetical protein